MLLLNGMPRPLTPGEVALRSNDGEGEDANKKQKTQRYEPCLKELLYRCAVGFILPGLPSQALTRQLILPLSLARHLPPAGGSLSKGEPLAKRRPGTDAGKIKAASRKRPMLPRGPECFADIAGAPSDGGTAGYTRCGQSGHPAKEPRLYLRWCG